MSHHFILPEFEQEPDPVQTALNAFKADLRKRIQELYSQEDANRIRSVDYEGDFYEGAFGAYQNVLDIIDGVNNG
jgi:hypothetical protein